MSLTASFHGPYTFSPTHWRRDDRNPQEYVSFAVDDSHRNSVTLFFDTVAQFDDLIKAAIAARGLLPAAKPPATTCPVCGTPLDTSARCAVCTAVPIGEYPVSHLACGCQIQDVMPIGAGTPMVCERHGDTHVIAAAEAAQ